MILCFAVESYSRILGPHLNGHTRQTSPCWILYWSTWLCLTDCSQSWTNYGFLVYFSKKGFGMVQKWLVNSVDVRMLQESCLRITFICNMIVLFSILKQQPTVVIVKLWQCICCVYIYDCKIITTLNYDYFLIYKFVRMWNMSVFMQFPQNPNIFGGLAEISTDAKISIMVFNWLVLIYSTETCTILEYRIIDYTLPLVSLVYHLPYWDACALKKLQQSLSNAPFLWTSFVSPSFW